MNGSHLAISSGVHASPEHKPAAFAFAFAAAISLPAILNIGRAILAIGRIIGRAILTIGRTMAPSPATGKPGHALATGRCISCGGCLEHFGFWGALPTKSVLEHKD